MSGQTFTQPEVGMGVTEGVGSDCYPYTITKVTTSKSGVVTIELRRCDAKATADSDYYGKQEYTYSEREDDMWRDTWRWDARSESWRRLVEKYEGGPLVYSCPPRRGSRIHLGSRRYYQNPSF